MKIGIDISQIAYQGTGVAIYTQSLITSMVQVDPGLELVMFGSSLRNRQPLKHFYQAVRQLGANGKNVKKQFFPYPPKLLEFLWNGVHLINIESLVGAVDVFHTSDWLEPPSHCPKVTTIHDLVVYKYPETFSVRGGHDIVANQRRKLHFVRTETDTVIAVSQTTKQDIKDILKIPDNKIQVVYEAANPIFCPQTDRQAAVVMAKYGVQSPYLLCVGTREPRKNLDAVFMAFTELSSAYPELQLVIVGKYGWGEENSKLKTQSANWRTKIRILGYVPKEELPALYSGAVCFVMPSLYEGFGLPILEAMACGCPVVTSDIGSMKEIASDAALLVDPHRPEDIATAVSKIIRNQETRETLIDKGFKRASDFSWNRAARETLDIYRELTT